MDLTKTLRHLTKKVGRIPRLRYPIVRFWNTYEHLMFSYHIRRNLRSENWIAEIDPFQLYYVSPHSVKSLSVSSFDLLSDTGKTYPGEWDQILEDISDGVIYNSFRKRFYKNVQWEQTAFYIRQSELIREGTSNRYTTLDEFHEKLQLYDRLYKLFKDGQYLTQYELAERKEIGPPGNGGYAIFPTVTNHTLIRHEIALNIGRDGTLIRNDGRHRLALALLTGLDDVPVRIVVRHTEWQILRDQVVRAIEEARNREIPTDNIRRYVAQKLNNELSDVPSGLNHPDLDILFQRRLSDK